MNRLQSILLLWVAATVLAVSARGAEPAAESIEFFEREIRPLLVERCFECHGDGAELKGGLSLASRSGLLAGGESGAAAMPGKPAESLLVEAIRYQGLKMPPKGKLSEPEIEKLVRWVELGLPWTAGGEQPAASAKSSNAEFQISAEQRKWWSFQPPRACQVPQVANPDWCQTPIDSFILAQLERQGIKANPPADKRTWLRRATFDLIGLPPSPDEMNAFMVDDGPNAAARVIDRLLASPHYGERWGRHWLDVVRYSDTAGETADYPIPQAYKYRNYVIDAWNRDMPFDQFVREQVAGDVLARSGPHDRYAEQVVATGFLAISRRFGFDSENYHHLTIADTIDTVGRSILGMSIGCARCHDHKYDPISMADYYALYGIFASSRYAFPGSEEKRQPRDMVPLLPADEAAPLAALHQQRLTECDTELKRIDTDASELQKQLKVAAESSSKNADGAESPVPAAASQLDALKQRQAAVDAARAAWRGKREQIDLAGPFEVAYAVVEGDPQNAKIQKRGEPSKLGAEVPRRFLEILGGDALAADESGSGRRELAEWLTRASNPLTARVIVNRVWQHHFGRGLVVSASDFGLRGRAPSHPELLDYLASELVSHDWSLKWLHRQIMLSHVYQLSSSSDNPSAGGDPTNAGWWRFERRRLDAEVIRDALLSASGELDRSPGGEHPFPRRTTWGFTQHAPFKAVYETRHRSVYLMTQRIQRHPFLGLFDGADSNTSIAERSLTTTPSQALFLMNDPFMHAQCEAFARRLLAEPVEEPARIRLAHAWALQAGCDAEQIAAASEFLAEYRRQSIAAGATAEAAPVAALAAYGRALFSSNAFLFVD